MEKPEGTMACVAQLTLGFDVLHEFVFLPAGLFHWCLANVMHEEDFKKALPGSIMEVFFLRLKC